MLSYTTLLLSTTLGLVVFLFAVFFQNPFYYTSQQEQSYCVYFSESEQIKILEDNMDTKLSAFLFGYSGGVGRSIVNALAKEPRFTKVTLFGRREIQLPNTTAENDGVGNFMKFKQEVIDFDNLSHYSSRFQEFDIGFYTLGVSAAKVDRETYRKVEYGYTVSIARMAQAGGCKHFHWLSGSGSNKNSWFLFGRTKAEIEEELCSMGFPRVSIYRPGGVLTDEDTGGMAGKTTVAIMRALDKAHWLSVESELLGKFIVSNCFREPVQKNEIFTNKDINELGKKIVKD